MLIESPRFGTIEVAEEEIVTFPDGLLGFSGFTRYYFHEPAPQSPLKWMQCVDQPALGFVVTDPKVFKPDYRARVAPSQLKGLEIDEAEEAVVWVILTIPSDPIQMTANLQGPLIVNRKLKMGAQVVVNEEGITTKYPVLAGAGAGENR